MLVTKETARYKPLGIHILKTGDANAVHWFLEDKSDIGSSNYLEDAVTEIQVQGLELDYTCLLWDVDMRYTWYRKVRKNYDKSIIHLPRQDTNRPSKKPLKSTFFGTQDPSSTPFCTPNFLKSPDVKVHERT